MPKANTRPGKSALDDLLAASLASGLFVAKTAQKHGVSENTVRRRLGDDQFRARVAALKAEVIARCVAMAGDAMLEAIVRLRVLCRDSQSESVQLAAANSILDRGIQLRLHGDIEHRVQQLELRGTT
jgi:hypothetical protein